MFLVHVDGASASPIFMKCNTHHRSNENKERISEIALMCFSARGLAPPAQLSQQRGWCHPSARSEAEEDSH